MWSCVFVAARMGVKSSRQELSKDGRTYFRKAKFFAILALLIGLMKLHYSFKIAKELKHMQPEWEKKWEKNSHSGKDI